MNVTVEISDDKLRAIQAQAEAEGLTVEKWLAHIAELHAESKSYVHLQREDPQEWARRFDLWVDSHAEITTVLSDEAMSRESIYPDGT